MPDQKYKHGFIVITRIFGPDERIPKTIRVDGKVYTQYQPGSPLPQTGRYPRWDGGLGVMAPQAAEAHAASVEAGCATDFNKTTGAAWLTDSTHEQNLRQSVYGDYQKEHRHA